MNRRLKAAAAAPLVSLALAAMPAGAASSTPGATDAGDEHAVIAVEAESFQRQSLSNQREWLVVSAEEGPEGRQDGDGPHHESASGGAYLEVLPDTRRTHGDKLIAGENFSNEPGKIAVLDYAVTFERPGRYYVWVRAFSTGSEDNGIHVGLDGEWPASGERMQWCKGKQQWWWESRQRTAQEHCGAPHAIYLDVPTAGEHTVSFSMREDGFEFDKFLLTTNRGFARPEGVGPAAVRFTKK